MIYAGVARIGLRAAYVRSLKEKRSIVLSLKTKVQHQFKVAVAEVEDLNQHQSIVVAVAAVSNERQRVEETLHHILDYIQDNFDVEIVREEINIEQF
ncbi:DUF503 domain-containing protein [Proteiniclasticum sp. BAD-10]|uniref:DUF503 domain-containing protein n=1 Tax=Proteiniclasticum sediminis TaxID=2804028 RepID=A0A941HQE5_9CLOT|nr:DUF503 domain-containing protein [Proteiniclasticum sediminis]MBR0575398.1 DUF503 domain-containing protein [Proteiniclasticum sediminis]